MHREFNIYLHCLSALNLVHLCSFKSVFSQMSYSMFFSLQSPTTVKVQLASTSLEDQSAKSRFHFMRLILFHFLNHSISTRKWGKIWKTIHNSLEGRDLTSISKRQAHLFVFVRGLNSTNDYLSLCNMANIREWYIVSWIEWVVFTNNGSVSIMGSLSTFKRQMKRWDNKNENFIVFYFLLLCLFLVSKNKHLTLG